MSLERQAAPAPEPAQPGGGLEPAVGDHRLQILTTEHWSLLATRSLTWNESFSRVSMFLSVLSGAIVALALVAQAADFRGGFLAFAIPLLSVVLFVGLATFGRVSAINNEDSLWVTGMNRIRHGYLEIEPTLGRYFVTGSTDDLRGALVTAGFFDVNAAPTAFSLGALAHGMTTIPGMLAVIVGVVGGALAAVIAVALGTSEAIALVAGVVGFLVVFVGLSVRGYRTFASLERDLKPEFPTPRAGDGRGGPEVGESA
jgi:hypothetical protein